MREHLNKNNIKRILVIKFGGIGDILLSTPVLPNLREYFPDAEIDFLTLIRNRDVLMDNKYISRVLTYDMKIDRSRDFIRHIRRKKYNLIFDLFSNPRTALLTFLSGAEYRVGYKFRYRSYAYNIICRGRGGEVHNAEFNLDALRAAGIPVKYKNLNLSINIVHEEFADKFIKEENLTGKSLAGITLTGGWESKKYKVKDYIELINELLKIYDIDFLLLWGNQKERKEAETIKDSIPERTHIIPESPIRYLAALIKKCSLIIGNDSGPLHIAGAVNVPVLGFYGPTNYRLQGPFGENNIIIENTELDCLHCGLLDCPIGNVCMTQIPKKLIVDKFKELTKLNSIELKPAIIG